MAGITGQGTTYNLPNFTGELFGVSPEDTPFLSAIGGLTGGENANGSTVFTWQTSDLRDADTARQRLEGADAPGAEERVRAQGSNVLEIHQEAVEVSYTKLAAAGQLSGIANAGESQPVQNELAWQLQQSIKQVARDVEAGFLTGSYSLPATNASARKTRGLIEAIEAGIEVNDVATANVVEVESAATQPAVDWADVTAEDVLDLMQEVWTNGGIQESETRTLIVNARAKRALTKLFVSDKGYQEQTRNVGGVNLQTIETDFGRANIMLNRYAPADVLIVASLEECAPVFLPIPGKGHFFAEPLAKTGAADKVQLYGEIGLKYGNALKHGLLRVVNDVV